MKAVELKQLQPRTWRTTIIRSVHHCTCQR